MEQREQARQPVHSSAPFRHTTRLEQFNERRVVERGPACAEIPEEPASAQHDETTPTVAGDLSAV